MNPHETRNDFILSLVQILVGASITLVCIACGFVLFSHHVEGGAYFLGLVSGTPATALTYQLGKSIGEKKAAQATQTPPLQINATAQAGDKPDGSSASVTSAPVETPTSASYASTTSPAPPDEADKP